MKMFVFVISQLLWTITFAQIEVSVIDRAADRDELVEPSVAISLKNNDQIVIGASPDKVFYSEDGGSSWNKTVITSSYSIKGHPKVLADRKGKFYYLHQTQEGLILTLMSKDGGATWSEQGVLSSNENVRHIKPGVTLDSKGKLMASWTQLKGDEDDGTSNIYLSFSSSGGSKWSNTTKLNKAPGKCCENNETVMGAVPVVYDNDRYFIVWSHNEKIYLDRSLDGGKFWLKNEGSVVDQPGGWHLNIPGLKSANGLPSFKVFFDPKGYYNGRLLLLWSDQRNGLNDTDIWFAHSDNRGDSFQTPIRINDDDTGRHQFHPAMTIDQSTGMIYILYYDRRNSTGMETEVYLAYSNDGGLSFKNRKLSESAFDLPDENVSLGNYIGISASGGRIAAAWTAFRDNRTEIRSTVFDHEQLEK